MPGFSTVSFREKEGADLAGDIIEHAKIVVTLDPTLLLVREEYCKLVKGNSAKGRYIFLYTVIMSESTLEIAEHISKKLSLPVEMLLTSNSVHSAWRAKKHGIKVKMKAGPEEFLSLVQNAALVLTNSFHGAAFSSIFHKQFYCVREYRDGALVPENRLDSLLNRFNLQSRIITAESCNTFQYDTPIEWEELDNLLRKERERCIEWLKSAIDNTVSRETQPVYRNESQCCGRCK